MLAASVLVAATTVVVAQFLSATPAVVAVGDESVRLGTVGWRFGPWNTAVIAVATCAAGASATVLLTNADSAAATASDTEAQNLQTTQSTDSTSNELLQARRQEWETVSERLANNEELVYKTVLDADGVLPQSEIVDQTDLSKATVSRTLDSLETRDLIERKRRGMGNIVLLT
ncbi:MarR family transcriptional regulator [Haloarcula sp. CBA1130]|nr:MarR family transcriptional regulator [Haloarcula sp. CBA1130]KAA9397701.1 MarR family transcriptional regulator [Haloarcula sp. CBA1129]